MTLGEIAAWFDEECRRTATFLEPAAKKHGPGSEDAHRLGERFATYGEVAALLRQIEATGRLPQHRPECPWPVCGHSGSADRTELEERPRFDPSP